MMKKGLSFLSLLLLASSMLLLTSPVSSATTTSFLGTWSGVWSAPEGWVYTARMSLRTASGNAINGEIYWTFKQAPASRTDYAGKTGLTGTEYVSGRIEGNELLLDGYKLDDPNRILGLDKYRLILSDSGTVLGGITEHHGTWNGQFLLTR